MTDESKWFADGAMKLGLEIMCQQARAKKISLVLLTTATVDTIFQADSMKTLVVALFSNHWFTLFSENMRDWTIYDSLAEYTLSKMKNLCNFF